MAACPPRAPELFFLWAPLVWPDHASLAVFFEDARGLPMHAEGKRVPLYAQEAQVPGIEDPATLRFHGVGRQIDYAQGTRRAAAARLSLMHGDGHADTLTLEPLLRFQMKGTGYGHPLWKHGTWHGELATGTDRWRPEALDPLAPENLHIQQLVRLPLRRPGGPGRAGAAVHRAACTVGLFWPQRWRGLKARDDGRCRQPRTAGQPLGWPRGQHCSRADQRNT